MQNSPICHFAVHVSAYEAKVLARMWIAIRDDKSYCAADQKLATARALFWLEIIETITAASRPSSSHRTVMASTASIACPDVH